jgi:hypothetical protein
LRFIYLFANSRHTFLSGFCIASCCIKLALELVLEVGVVMVPSALSATAVGGVVGALMCSIMPMQADRLPASTITDSNRLYDSDREREGEERRGLGGRRTREGNELGIMVERSKDRILEREEREGGSRERGEGRGF